MRTKQRSVAALLASAATTLVIVGLGTTNAQATPAPSAAVDTAQLRALSTTQSRAEIDALVSGTDPVSLYVDAATGEVLAAAPAPDSTVTGVHTRALTPIGPGCTSTSVCMRSISGTPYGLTGTGTRTGTWKKIISYSSGDRETSFWASNGMAYTYRAYSNVTLNVTVTITKVQR
ncbi:hypothetical protein JOE58_001049 [Curtobacterium luteum]|uniref:Uncharacterized protein n=1 Tax=Curtobacterium luteum TaxID=33881 RepID=A0A8H9G815_9MICO|nr:MULTISPECIES: hypothetical protein [Curtobacterium]MBM7801798.1 hypothetical protein [Curtobacterium luteum]NUU51883.1 hypothetical protein [Curtobacterium luteum]GGK87603.1 hypothetical protein GCM10009769_02050 [Curtobacterium luteum]